MATITLEIWVDPDGDESLLYAGELGAESRRKLPPGSKMLKRIRAGSHFEAMTLYHEFLGREPYSAPWNLAKADRREWEREAKAPYPDDWVARNS